MHSLVCELSPTYSSLVLDLVHSGPHLRKRPRRHRRSRVHPVRLAPLRLHSAGAQRSSQLMVKVPRSRRRQAHLSLDPRPRWGLYRRSARHRHRARSLRQVSLGSRLSLRLPPSLPSQHRAPSRVLLLRRHQRNRLRVALGRSPAPAQPLGTPQKATSRLASQT
jgi:hypothetical protein